MKAVVQTVMFEEDGDVLVFLTGQEEIEETHQVLTEKLEIVSLALNTMNKHAKGEAGEEK